MGTSVERRLAKLEAAHRQAAWRTSPAGCAARARKAIDNGTASLEDYGVGDPDGVATRHRQLLAYGVLVAMREALGWSMHEEPEGVLAFPPGQEVPYNPRCWFGFNAGVSKWSPTNVERQANGPPLPGFLLPANRRQAAYKTLAMGEPCGEPLREELWRREGDGWTLSDEAWAVVDEFWMTWPDMEYLLRHECVVLKEVAPPADELAVRAYVLQDGVMHVPCSEVIRLMECLGPDPRGSAVQGQNRSYKVIRLLPDSCLNPSERKAPP